MAPHQPRVDFRLWLYGLRYRHGTPDYATALLERMCEDPGSLQGLFATELPVTPRAARIAFCRYQFTTGEQAQRTGQGWIYTT